MQFSFSYSFGVIKTFLQNMFLVLVLTISLFSAKKYVQPLLRERPCLIPDTCSLALDKLYLEMLGSLLKCLHCLPSIDRTEGEDIRINSLRVSIHLLTKGHLLNSKL